MAATTTARSASRSRVTGRARSGLRRGPGRGWILAGYVALALFAIWTVVPFYWMILASIKTNKQLYQDPSLFPSGAYWGNYEKLFTGPFLTWVKNSAVVAVGTTAFSILVGSFGAYSIARLRFVGRNAIARILVFSYLIPASLLFIPLFQIVASLNLVNNLGSLLIVYLTFTVPFCTWLLIGYFKTIPAELEEAALIDGSSKFGVLFRVTLPLALPAIAVVALFSFTLSWNEFLYALVFISTKEARTATVGLNSMVADDVFFWGQMMGGAVLTSIPPVVVYILAQRLVVKGLTVGGVKG